MPHLGYFFNPLDYFESPPADGETKKGPNSDWGFDHKADPNAHHAKYTDAEARAVHSPLSIPPSAFVSRRDTQDWSNSQTVLMNRASLEMQEFFAPVILPHGVTITRLTMYGYRDDALSQMLARLYRANRELIDVTMATVTALWDSGWSSVYDETISSATIDNENYHYTLHVYLDPNDDVNDVQFSGVKIEFT